MKALFILLFLAIGFKGFAQTETDSLPPLDKSPMDESYYPDNYPILNVQGRISDKPVMRIIYSRPQMNGRKIFGDLQPYGTVWRLGANEATEIQFFTDVKINEKKIAKGRYTVYVIPYPDRWIVIINKATDTWGSFRYDSTLDVARMTVPVEKHKPTEALTIVFKKDPKGADMDMYWEDVKVSLPVIF
jgi:Protein of unknown function (DUF2911)